jgi:hypothetical protein
MGDCVGEYDVAGLFIRKPAYSIMSVSGLSCIMGMMGDLGDMHHGDDGDV